MQARSAVRCRSARLSEAVSPAKSARVAIGLIVVKSVAKSLLILIRQRRHRSYFLIYPSYFFLSCVRCRFKQTAGQRRDKASVSRSRMERAK